MNSFRKVVVLMGGTSNERAVSLVSGGNVARALATCADFQTIPLSLDNDNLDALPPDTDACYVALHGGWGENGGVQAALDARGIPYTGPGASACRITLDKIETKRLLDAAGVPTAHWTVCRAAGNADSASASAALPNANAISYPVVVKAPRDGSSVGVYIVREAARLAQAVAEAQRIDAEKGGPGEALIEQFIPGREVTVAVLDEGALPVVEIVTPNGWYGYEEKYNSDETRYPVWDAAYLAAHPEDQELAQRLSAQAVAAFKACGCRGVTRVDFRVTPAGETFVLELNTSPGMTGHSLVPKAAAAAGYDFTALCLRILSAARCDAPHAGSAAT